MIITFTNGMQYMREKECMDFGRNTDNTNSFT
jgi:hypothetical protein